MNKKYVKFNERVSLAMPFSEVCMYMRVAGTVLEAELQPTPSGAVAQLYKDGREFSFPITTGEAGFYSDEGGYYYYPDFRYSSNVEDTPLYEF